MSPAAAPRPEGTPPPASLPKLGMTTPALTLIRGGAGGPCPLLKRPNSVTKGAHLRARQATQGQKGHLMKVHFCIIAAAAMLAGGTARADEFLGSYVARISDNDHHASDGYPLDTAAQMVRQDRANWHKFGSGDAEDENDVWFGSTAARARFEKMLGNGSAMSGATRKAIANGEPIVEVEVYRQSVKVRILGY